VTGIRIASAGAPLYVGAIPPGIQVAQSGGAASPLLADLTAYWKLDDLTWSDSVGGNDLTNNGSVTVGTPKVGAGSAEFDGSNFLSLASNSDVQMDGDFTIACWVYLAVLDGTRQKIVGKDAIGSREYTLQIDQLTNELVFNVQGSGRVPDSTVPTTNTWYFLVADYRASDNRIRLIVNDGTPNETTGIIPATVGSAEFQIGARQFSGFEDFISNGSRIDEVGIWKRLLTSGEISDLYNSGSGLSYPFS
jgi:hypothetical protein